MWECNGSLQVTITVWYLPKLTFLCVGFWHTLAMLLYYYVTHYVLHFCTLPDTVLEDSGQCNGVGQSQANDTSVQICGGGGGTFVQPSQQEGCRSG